MFNAMTTVSVMFHKVPYLTYRKKEFYLAQRIHDFFVSKQQSDLFGLKKSVVLEKSDSEILKWLTIQIPNNRVLADCELENIVYKVYKKGILQKQDVVKVDLMSQLYPSNHKQDN